MLFRRSSRCKCSTVEAMQPSSSRAGSTTLSRLRSFVAVTRESCSTLSKPFGIVCRMVGNLLEDLFDADLRLPSGFVECLAGIQDQPGNVVGAFGGVDQRFVGTEAPVTPCRELRQGHGVRSAAG